MSWIKRLGRGEYTTINGVFISYNPNTGSLGGDTADGETAFQPDGGDTFAVMNGDHRKGLEEVVKAGGLTAALAFYDQHKSAHSS